jgi:signal transduction histidine kinase
MWPWSKIRTRVLLVPLVPAAVLAVVVGFDLQRSPGVIALAALAVIAGFALAIAVARSITRPLRDLAAIVADTTDLRALEGSLPPRDDMLPPRHLRSASPLSELAIAVAEGRRRAAEIVTDQQSERRSVTDLIANLALRNERLLGAALDALGEIARRDHEPATAAAIARVHRIVARVDRSTASALVLIGEGGRVAPHPATITDVVWAAALAIESSDRVDAVSLPAATVHADVVADVAHLLAEIIDNAVGASASPARVTVLGAPAADGGYEVTVMDAGTGMSDNEIDLANARVRRLELLHRVPTRHIGLDVVGRLARRHGVSVRLGDSAEGGVVVRVMLPPALLTAPAAPVPGLTWVHSEDDEERGVAAPTPAAPAAPVAASPAPSTTPAIPAPSVPLAPPAALESWRVAQTTTAEAPAPVAEPVPVPVTIPQITIAPEPVSAPEPAAPEPEPVVEPGAEVAPAPEVVAVGPEPIAWSIDLTAMEHPTTSPDELLPRREPTGTRKWAAAIARARS